MFSKISLYSNGCYTVHIIDSGSDIFCAYNPLPPKIYLCNDVVQGGSMHLNNPAALKKERVLNSLVVEGSAYLVFLSLSTADPVVNGDYLITSHTQFPPCSQHKRTMMC